MKLFSFLLIVFLSVNSSLGIAQTSNSGELSTVTTKNPMKLWYSSPAEIWEEALPVGNGRLGAMVFGDPHKETIQLNEETIWAGEPGNNIQAEIREHLPKIRQLIFADKYAEAQELANTYLPWDTPSNYGMSYQAMGNLEITYPDEAPASDYYRELDLTNAVSKVSYTKNDISYTRQVFSSFEDDVIVIEMDADQTGSISFALQMNSPHQTQNTSIESKALHFSGTSSDMENKSGKVDFSTIVKPKISGGELSSTDSSLVVKNADKVTLFVSIGTNFIN